MGTIHRPWRGGGKRAGIGIAALLIASVAVALPAPQRSSAATASAPNIVMIVLDDVGTHDGRLWRALPAIRDTFIEEGIEFTDFHVETPVCCPGRAGFLTGLHTHAHGVTRNRASLLRPTMTIATQLRRSGYHTIHIGKYLNGYQYLRRKVPPGWSDFHAIGKGFYDYDLWSNGRRRHFGRASSDYSTDVIARTALAALDRAPARKPLFLWLAPFAAHTPLTPAPRHRVGELCHVLTRWKPPGYMEKNVRDKPAYVRARRRSFPNGKTLRPACRTLLSVDEMLADVKRRLDRRGRTRDTLFILTADNGMNDGMHRFLNDKKTPYATQIPFLVAWPRVVESPRRVSERLQNIDLAPTLCDLVGCRMGPYPTGQRRPDGRSFASIIRGTSSAVRRDSVLASFGMPSAKVPRWWGVETTRHSPLAGVGCALAAEHGCRWSYVRYETGEKELYDLSNGPCHAWSRGQAGDPCRLRNLAGMRTHRAVQRALEKRLAALRRG